MFDPEKVERWDGPAFAEQDCDGPFTPEEGGYFVKASDYDQLLELYRQERQRAESYADGIQYGA
jgi:hypothetical protein